MASKLGKLDTTALATIRFDLPNTISKIIVRLANLSRATQDNTERIKKLEHYLLQSIDVMQDLERRINELADLEPYVLTQRVRHLEDLGIEKRIRHLEDLELNLLDQADELKRLGESIPDEDEE